MTGRFYRLVGRELHAAAAAPLQQQRMAALHVVDRGLIGGTAAELYE